MLSLVSPLSAQRRGTVDEEEVLRTLLIENRNLFPRYLTPAQRAELRRIDQRVQRGEYLIELGGRTMDVDERRLRPGETVEQFQRQGEAEIAEGEAIVEEAGDQLVALLGPVRERVSARFKADITTSDLPTAIDTQATEILNELKEKQYLRLLIDKAIVTVGDESTESTILHDPYRDRLIEEDGSDYRVYEPSGLEINSSPLPTFSYDGSDEVDVPSALILVEVVADASSNQALIASYGVDLKSWHIVSSRLDFITLENDARKPLGVPELEVLSEEEQRIRDRRTRRSRRTPPPYENAEEVMIFDENLLLERLVQLPQPYPMELETPDYEKTFERQVMERLLKHALAGPSGFPISADSAIERAYGDTGEETELGYSARTRGVIKLIEERRRSRSDASNMRLEATTLNSPDPLQFGPVTFTYPPEEEEED